MTPDPRKPATNPCRAIAPPPKARRERGNVVGLVLLAPAMVLLLLFTVGAGRIGVARSNVEAAARSAARAATLHSDVAAARAAATTAANRTLVAQRVTCASAPTVQFQSLNLRAGGEVRLQVTCHTRLSDLTPLQVPGTIRTSATATASVDRYRSR